MEQKGTQKGSASQKGATGRQSFRCTQCGAEFETREKLDDHNRRAHQKR